MSEVFDFERLALGLLINHASSVKEDMALVKEDFATTANQIIVEAINEMDALGLQIDLMLLAEFLQKKGNLDKAGGIAYLTLLSSSSPAKENAKSYAGIVKQHARGRQLVQAGTKIQSILSNLGDPDVKLLEVEDILQSLAQEVKNEQCSTIIEALNEAIEIIEAKVEMAGKEPEFAFGFKEIDEMTLGAQRGDLVIVAARPSMGKTAMSMNIVENYCKRGKKGLVVSIEMSASQLALRMIASIGRIDVKKIRAGILSEDDWARISFSLGQLNNFKLHIDQSPEVSPGKIRRMAKKVARDYGGIDFIVVDYLQLMVGDKSRYDNRSAEISDISRSMKLLAKEFNIPVILLSQLNRSLEQRANKRPVMSDLRESGSIEQDADIILFIYRDEVYNPDSSAKGSAEIIVSKQRNGPTGSINLAFKKEISKFEDLGEFHG